MAEAKDIKAVLADAIKKRDELNTFIKVLQEMSGATISVTEPSADGAQQSLAPGQEIADPLSAVFPGMFWGKSQTQAVKMLLERVRRPVKLKTIIECLSKGGLEIGGKNPNTNLWSVLNRANETFVIVPKAGWGLIDWYDASVIAKMRKESVKENGDEEEKSEKEKPEKPDTDKPPVWKPKG